MIALNEHSTSIHKLSENSSCLQIWGCGHEQYNSAPTGNIIL